MRPCAARLALPPLLAALTLIAQGAGAQGVPPLEHVVVVVMENKSHDEVRALPYTASLMAASATCANAFAIQHPSQPNSIALWCGSTRGVSNDVCPPLGSPWPYENLSHARQSSGRSWKAYCEGLPAPGSTVCTAPNYVRRHCPWTYFSNVGHTRERPFTDVATDVAPNALPTLVFVIPDQCHNTHNCSLATGDAWLAANMPSFIQVVGPRGVVILTWDEDDATASNHVLTRFAGPMARSGYVSSTHFDHIGLVRTLCDGHSIPPMASASVTPPVTDAWVVPTPAESGTWGRPPPHDR